MTTLGTLGTAAVLGSAGLVMGALSLTGWLSTAVEFGLWVAIGVAWILLGARMETGGPVGTLLLVGLVAGLLTGGVQAVFAQALVDNNDAYAEDVEGEVDGSTRLQFFAVTTGVGLVWGLLVGLVAWGLQAADVVGGWG